jgi:hypothetical protein
MPHWLTNAVPIQGQVTRFSAADTIFHTSYYINNHNFSRDPTELSLFVVTERLTFRWVCRVCLLIHILTFYAVNI